ncbi:MAG: hypothetical protein GY756_19710, partial [bacterium]|nr:hypothetical protein [bacterium]
NFFIEVKYSIKNSNYGKISLFIQDKNRTLNPNEKSIILKKGTGVIYICSKIIIPDAKTINLFLPLSGVNKKQANIVAFRTYKVNS